jgi:peptide/nickel transport system permease protein
LADVTAPGLVVAVEVPKRFATLRRLLRRRGALIPIVVLLVIIVSAAFAPLIAPYNPKAIDAGNQFAGLSTEHWLGTDELGRDLFSRILFGGRLAIGIALAATVIALVAGVIWGGIAALVGRLADDLLMRIVDTAMAIPFLLLALVFVAAFGARLTTLAIILGILHVPVTARMARAAFLSEIHSDYRVAATAYGASRKRLLFSEILPNVIPTLLVQASLVAASVILTEAALSFVGLGVQPPDASWGTLLLQGYGRIYSSYSYVIFPGVMIFVSIWALNTLADHLQAVLDPRSGG